MRGKWKIKKEKCSRCGFLDVRALDIHHKDRVRKNNDVSNLQVLCRNCHKIEHREEDIIRIKNIDRRKTYIKEVAEIMCILEDIVPEEYKGKMMRLIELLIKRRR